MNTNSNELINIFSSNIWQHTIYDQNSKQPFWNLNVWQSLNSCQTFQKQTIQNKKILPNKQLIWQTNYRIAYFNNSCAIKLTITTLCQITANSTHLIESPQIKHQLWVEVFTEKTIWIWFHQSKIQSSNFDNHISENQKYQEDIFTSHWMLNLKQSSEIV